MPNPTGFYKSIFGPQFGLLGMGATAANPLNTVEAAADGVTVFGKNQKIAADGLTATAGGGQALALQLSATFNTVTTVASSGDSVKTPIAMPGAFVVVRNDGANALQLFATGTDTIDGSAGAVGVSQGASTSVQYFCSVAGKWHSLGDRPPGTVGNQLFLSTQPGIFAGGVTDSRNGLNTAIQTAAATNKPLVIDCILRVTIGTDITKAIFLPPSASIFFMPGCYIITDHVLVPLFVMCNSSNVTFYNYNVQYVGTFGVTAIDQQNPASAINGVLASFNDTTVKTYMGANWGNTFSGSGSSIFPSATNACAQILISGQAKNINFLGKTRAWVPVGAPACNFIPCFISCYAQWLPNQLITSALQASAPIPSTAAVPDHILIEDLEIDGCYMGIVGTATHVQVNNCRSIRYSDIQDANGNNVGGQNYNAVILASTPVTGNTTITFSSPWTYSSKTYTVTFSDGSTRSVPFVNGSATSGAFSALGAGTFSSTVQVSYSAAWFAPPHLFYLHSLDFAFNFPCTQDLGVVFDEGVYVGTPNRRGTGSGYLNSIKVEPANGSKIVDYTSQRPDGGMDLLAFGNANGAVKIFCVLNTSTAQTGQCVFTGALSAATSANLTAPWAYGSGSQTYTITFSNGTTQTGTFVNGQTLVTWPSPVTATAVAGVLNTSQGANFLWRFPSSPPMVGLSLDYECIDTATAPPNSPCQGDTQILNTGINLRGRVTLNDIPFGSSWQPGFSFGGNNIFIDHTIILKSCSSNFQNIGFFPNTGTTTLTESSVNVTVVGWRSAAVSFTGALSAASSATLTGWNYGDGTYTFAFSNGEERQVAVTGTAAAWTGAITGTALANVLLLNGGNVDNFKNRVQIAQKGFCYGTLFTFVDTTNGITQTIRNNLLVEDYVQQWQGSPTGTSYSTPISFPTTFAIIAASYCVTTAFTGAASLSIGWAGSTTALVNAGAVALNTNPWNNPGTQLAVVVPVSTPIVLTPNASITGGTMYMSVAAQRYQMGG